MNKIFFILVGMFILCSVFVQSTYPNEGGTGVIINSLTSLALPSSEPVIIRLCEGCSNNGKCYNLGARLTINPQYPKQDLAWKNISNLYCGEGGFVSQKITEETCENDFECQSNICNNLKCGQENRIKEAEIYNDKSILIKNLIFQEKETFYFKGLDKTYSIGFGKNDSDYLFLINNNFSSYENKTFILNNNSQFIFNSIIFNDNVAKANVTFIESKNPINDQKKLIEQLTCEGLFVNELCKKEGESFVLEGKNYIVENKSPKEVSNQGNSAPITGNVIGTQKENFFSKILNFFKNLFSKK